MPIVDLVLRWGLGFLMLGAGLSKLPDLPSVRASLRNYGLVPEPAIAAVARALVAGELLLGAMFITGVLPREAGAAALVMLIAFAGAIVWNLVHGREFDCGCGLGSDTPISWWLVARNLCLAVASGAVAVGSSGALAVLPAGAATGSAGLGVLVPVPMIVLLAAVVVRLIAVAGDARRSRPLANRDTAG
ncbi:MAG: MauE/DoxX family redox-associated membrane protein [Solirubrobacteraceae bacterium]